MRCRQPFSYTDAQPSEKSFYRIRVGDLDGKFYSSKIIALYGQAKGFDITSITPTIITNETMVNVSSSSSGNVELIITSSTGVTVKRKTLTVQKGNNSFSLQLADIMKGFYFLSVTNAEGETKISQFIKR